MRRCAFLAALALCAATCGAIAQTPVATSPAAAVYVQLDGNGNVTGIFANPQPGNPNVSAISASDPRVAAFQAVQAIPALVQQQISAGCQITSTATPALNATYAIDGLSRANIVAIELSLNAGKGFPPGGASTLNYPDTAGAPHSFTATNFTNFAAAIRDCYYGIAATAAALQAGQSATFPAQTETIP